MQLQFEKEVDRVWIIDVDAHKGDGTAALTAGDDSIRTLSVHMASGWPLDCPALLADGRPNPSFIPSDIDISIESGEEPQYLERLRDRLIYTWLMERKIPAVFLMAGGYGDEVWRVYAQFLLWALHRRYEHI